jgi:hypothetical protein
MQWIWPTDQGLGRKAAPALVGVRGTTGRQRPNTFRETMRFARLRLGVATAGVAVLIAASNLSFAQNAEPKAGDQHPPADKGKDPGKKAVDVYAEAAKRLGGSPAANPECVWLGHRVVNLLWHDDLDTAFRHLDLYDRFGCPSGHIQMTFRCVAKTTIDPKAAEVLNKTIMDCWDKPDTEPPASAAAAVAPPAQAQ